MCKTYSIKFDRRSNGILIKEGNKLTHMIAVPPGTGIFIIPIVSYGFDYNFKGLMVISSELCSSLYYEGQAIDYKDKTK